MHIQNQDMDAIDLKKGGEFFEIVFLFSKFFFLITALDIIQNDFKTETKNIEEQMSVQLYSDYNLSENMSKNLTAEPQQPPKGLGKLVALMKIMKASTSQQNDIST